MTYLRELSTLNNTASNGRLLSEEWTGKDAKGIGHILISCNASIPNLARMSKDKAGSVRIT